MAIFENEAVAVPVSIGDIEIVVTESPDGAMVLGYGVQVVLSDGEIRERRGDAGPIVEALASEEQRDTLAAFVGMLRQTAEEEML